ncbi:early nodulin-like protein 1 [Tanacetum coccineum]
MGSTKVSLLCFVIGLALFSMNVHVSEALEFVVGGKENSWRVPSAPDALNTWAEKERFKTGDVLVFKFDPKKDSVIQVQEGDYKKCITTKPIMEYKDSPAKVKLVESGAFYFVSGAEGSCDKGEKLAVKVLSHKHAGGSSAAPTPSATPSSSPSGSSSNVVPPPAEAPKGNAAGSMAIGVSSVVMTALVAVAMA